MKTVGGSRPVTIVGVPSSDGWGFGVFTASLAIMSIPLRVLVCDDELMARKRVLRLLGELPGIEGAIECESGEEVLAKLKTEDVDVAILDINMPGLSGL